VAYVYDSSYARRQRKEDLNLMPARGKSARPYQKQITKAKRTKGVTQVVEPLPSNCKALCSNPSTAKKRKNFKKENITTNNQFFKKRRKRKPVSLRLAGVCAVPNAKYFQYSPWSTICCKVSPAG
jgi:hypothetical protein